MFFFKDFKECFGICYDEDEGGMVFVFILQVLFVFLMSIGCLIGVLFGVYIVDWWGWRKSMLFGVVIFIIGNIIQIILMNIWIYMMMGCLVVGFGVGNFFVGVFMFQFELFFCEICGVVVVSYQFMIIIGIFVFNIINYGVCNIEELDVFWCIVIGLGIVFFFLFGIGIFIVFEFFCWLVVQGCWDQVCIFFVCLCGFKYEFNNVFVENDFSEMKVIFEKEKQVGIGIWVECFYWNFNIFKLFWCIVFGFGIYFFQ